VHESHVVLLESIGEIRRRSFDRSAQNVHLSEQSRDLVLHGIDGLAKRLDAHRQFRKKRAGGQHGFGRIAVHRSLGGDLVKAKVEVVAAIPRVAPHGRQG
jgi:hypothetical protein